MTPRKKVWELQGSTICKVIGMALDFEDLKKIGRKFGLSFQDSPGDEEFAFHSTIVSMCGKENKLSRYVQKLLEKRCSRYARRLSQRDAGEITELALNGDENGGVPLWAILWHLVTIDLCGGIQGETALFGRLHMLEHKLLKDLSNWTPEDRDAQESRHKEEVKNMRREILRLQSLTNKLERTNLRLKARLSNSCTRPETSSLGRTRHRSGDTAIRDSKNERLRLLLEEERRKNRELNEECRQSKEQIKSLAQELVSLEPAGSAALEKSTIDARSCPLKHCLRGKRIAMVGGIDSLEPHYRALVEKSGGEFCRHNGRCCRGGQNLEECIRSADLVVCPVNVNSHFGATGVKKVCRRYGIRCCFPDSAGLGALRTTLLQHFSTSQVDIREDSR